MSFGALLVTGADGSQQEIVLDTPTAILGRSTANTIVLDELSIARRHARLSFDSGRLLIEDLGSATGTFINGAQLTPHQPSLVDAGDQIRFGEVLAYYVEPTAFEEPAERAEGGAVMPAGAGSSLRIALSAPAARIIPGGEAVIIGISVTNAGNVVDEIGFEVRGLPADWIHMSQASVVLLPGDRREAGFAIRVPRTAEATAGTHEISVVATSSQTGREVLGAATVVIDEFEVATVELQPRRAKKNFKVLLSNQGNIPVAYALTGSDEEETFKYQFEEPEVSLLPGETREVRLRIKRPRKWVGHSQAAPFKIKAEPQHESRQIPTGEAQLQIRPVLGALKFSPANIMLLALIVAIGAYFFWPRGDGLGPGNAEAAFAGVHLCDESEERQQEASAPAPTEAPEPGQPGFQGVAGGPFYAQNDPLWADVEYARAGDPTFGPDWCGTTISQCGCAMTSVATVMALYSLVEMPDGSELSPETLNAWFNGNARLTERGWVSQGYIYGDVIWTAANQLSAEMKEKNPSLSTIRFARTGSGSEAEIRSELEAGRPIILEVPGHWIAAVGIEEGTDRILINDPFYRDRTHLDTAYPDLVKSSVLFEASDDLSAVVFTAPSDVRMRITDKQGRVVGTLNTGTAEDAESAAVVGIPGASYSSRQAWRDPTCIMSPPPADAGTNQIVLPGGADDYTLEIVDTGGRPASVAVHTYGQNGEPAIATIETDRPTVAEVSVNDDGTPADVTILEDRTPTPESEVTTLPQDEATPETTGTTEPTEVPSPTATPTPPPLETALSLGVEAGQTRLEVGDTTGFSVGDAIVVDPGTAIEESNSVSGVGAGAIIVASPLRFSHSPGAVIVRIRAAPPNPDGSPPGGGGGEVPEPLVPPESVQVGCSTLYNSSPKRATVICGATIVGEHTSLQWTSNGTVINEAANRESLFLSFEEDTSTTIVLTACNVTICRSTSVVEAIRFPLESTLTPGGDPTTPGQPVPPPPPETGITIACATNFNALEGSAQVNCVAAFPEDEPYTSITWSAPGAAPAAQTSLSPEFTTFIQDPEAVLRITATICNFSQCSTSEVFELAFGETIVEVAVFGAAGQSPNGEYPQFAPITITATVRGPSTPTGGFVNFSVGAASDGTPIGAAQPLIPAGDFGFASITIEPSPNNPPLDGEVGSNYNLFAAYSGGATLFPGVSEPVNITIVEGVPDDCDSVDNDGDEQVDEDCEFQVPVGSPRTVGGGTNLHELRIIHGVFSDDDVNVAPGTLMTVAAEVSRTSYCPGCIRQVYLAIAANETNGTPPQGPTCVISAVLPAPPTTFSVSTQFTAPSTPGVYYVRASGSLQYSCVSVPVGPPSTTVGRIVVQGTTTTTLSVSPSTVDLGNENPVQVTALVGPTNPAVGAPAGTVTFSGIATHSDPDPQLPLCSRSDQDVNPTTPVPLQNGTVTIDCDVSHVPGGNYTIRATYNPATTQPLGIAFYSCAATNSCTSADTPVLFIENPEPTITDGSGLSPSSVPIGDDRNISIFGSGFLLGEETTDEEGGTDVFLSYEGGCPANGTELDVNWDDNDQSPTRLDVTIPEADLEVNNAWIIVSNGTPGGGCDAEALTVTASGTSISGFTSDSPADLGESITFSGSVDKSAPGGGNLTGTVRICRGGTDSACTGGTEIGTDAVATNGDFSLTVTATTSLFTVGSNSSIRAYYLGSGNFSASQSGTISATINEADTTTDLTVSGSPAALGGSITLTAEVSSSYTDDDIAGDVTFRLGGSSCTTGTSLGTDALNADDTASISTTAIPAGTNQTVRACYDVADDDDNFNTSSDTATVTVNQATPTVSLVANPTTVDNGEDVTLTATVTQVGSFNPSGTVTFRYGGTNCADGTSLGSDSTPNGSDEWSLVTDDLPGGTHTVRACYGGDTNYNANSDTASVTVNAVAIGITLASNPTSPFYGGSTTLTATLVESLPGQTPTGNVTFCYGGTQANCSDGTASTTGAINGSGVATANITINQLGAVTIRAYYPGDSNFGSASDSEPVTVQQATTDTALTATPTTVLVNEDVTLEATVTFDNGGGTLSGNVTFWLGADANCDGGSAIATVVLSGGTADTTTNWGTAGSRSIRAEFLGSTNQASSCSSAVTVTVNNNPAPTVTDVTPDNADAGDPDTDITIAGTNFIDGVTTVTFDADGAGAGAPAAITFTIDSGTQITATIPAAQLAAAGSATVIVTNATPGGGSDSIAFTINAP